MCFRRLNPRFPSEVRAGEHVVGGVNFAHHNHLGSQCRDQVVGHFHGGGRVFRVRLHPPRAEPGAAHRVMPGISQAVADGDVISVNPQPA